MNANSRESICLRAAVVPQALLGYQFLHRRAGVEIIMGIGLL
jgi:hypothetical protein